MVPSHSLFACKDLPNPTRLDKQTHEILQEVPPLAYSLMYSSPSGIGSDHAIVFVGLLWNKRYRTGSAVGVDVRVSYHFVLYMFAKHR